MDTQQSFLGKFSMQKKPRFLWKLQSQFQTIQWMPWYGFDWGFGERPDDVAHWNGCRLPHERTENIVSRSFHGKTEQRLISFTQQTRTAGA